jgi:hypothetical protein
MELGNTSFNPRNKKNKGKGNKGKGKWQSNPRYNQSQNPYSGK